MKKHPILTGLIVAYLLLVLERAWHEFRDSESERRYEKWLADLPEVDSDINKVNRDLFGREW
jgi:hypothetical protein